MSTILHALGVALTLLAAFVKRRESARLTPGQPHRRYLVRALLAMSASLALTTPRVLAATAAVEPFPHSARLLGHALAMLAGFCLLAMRAHFESEPDANKLVRHRAIALIATIATMTALLIAAHPHASTDDTALHGGNLLMVAYTALYCGYLTWSLVVFGLVVRRIRRRSGVGPLLRIAMGQLTVGVVAAGAWVAWTLLDALVAGTDQLRGATMATLPDLPWVPTVLAAVSLTFIVLGSTFLEWSPQLFRLTTLVSKRKAYRRLEPLWAELVAALPGVRLGDVSTTVTERLHRRVIEIRDAQLQLAPYVPTDIHTRVENRRARATRAERADWAAVHEACEIVTALVAYRAGYRFARTAAPLGTGVRDAPRGTTLTEARRLGKVAAALTSSAIVATIHEDVEHQLAPPRARAPRPGFTVALFVVLAAVGLLVLGRRRDRR